MNKVIEKGTEKIVDKIIDKGIPLENQKINSNYENNNKLNFNIIDYKRDYSRSNVYADINYRDNFRGDRELLARAGFIYYIK